jgi:hypothetical protein
MSQSDAARRNRLAAEKSPYLLQHARNPVDWHPWSEEAFERARREDRPVFLSIGYSTCHWCHVMERESFQNGEIASLMNEAFVCVKVDREERPDVDALYMDVCAMLTGSGGWPLTIVMTADGKPFFAGTYFPDESRFGKPGMRELVAHIRDIWRTDRAGVLRAADEIASAVAARHERAPGAAPESSHPAGEALIERGFRELAARFDERRGGFGGAPKFPAPHNLLFLLRYWKRTGEPRALEMVERTLGAMRLGGIFDHVGFGFHRYSTDERWLVPHFEKMLYDQSTLAMAYTEAYQATGDGTFARTAREILAYVLRDMTAPEGGFASAEDADSEGVEGKYYLWSEREIRSILGGDDADLAIRLFGVREEGNFVDQSTGAKTGENILHLERPLDEWALELGREPAALERRVEEVRKRLLESRERRIRPAKDDKVLADWNGLMIAALAKGGRALAEPAFVEAARRAAGFVEKALRLEDGRLLRRYRDGEAAIPAQLDDHAFLVWGLIELYEATFDPDTLAAAVRLARECMARFDDAGSGAFFGSPDDGEKLLARRTEICDGALPSGNSVMLLNLLRLSLLTGNEALEARAARLAAAFAADAAGAPAAHTMYLAALDFATGPSAGVVVSGSVADGGARAMLRALAGRYLPSVTVILRPPGAGHHEKWLELAPHTRSLEPVEGRATAYVCRGRSCGLPVTSVEEMLRILGE